MSRGRGKWVVSVLPGTAWQLLFLLLPFGMILTVSFLSRSEYGGVEGPWTLENYQRLLGFSVFGFDPVYPMVIGRSLLLAAITALLCSLAALPLAFFIASLRGRWRLAGLVLLTAPVWTNLLVRTYGWQLLLGSEGWLSRGMAAIGLVAPGEALYPGPGAVLVGLVCDYLPFAALPLYASVERLDRSLVEAARDLGASWWSTFQHAVYPQIRAGLWAGATLVFLPATGQFVVPDLLGGAKTVLMGNVLQQQFGPARDWPFGAAFASVSMMLIVGAFLLYSRVWKKEKGGA